MKAKLLLSYDGSRFSGFARQKDTQNIETVTEVFEKCLKKCGIFSKLIGAGRTDAGVHATRQCVSFELPEYWHDAEKLNSILSIKLHQSIKIKRCEIVDDNFNPRFDVKKRAYRYVVCMSEPSPFVSHLQLFSEKLDLVKIQQGIEIINGQHDFSFFKKAGGNDKKTVRTLKAKCYTKGDFVVFLFESDGFLRSQIRLIVNFMLEIGSGRLTISQLSEQLGCIKKHTTKPAPPNGLYLIRVCY